MNFNSTHNYTNLGAKIQKKIDIYKCIWENLQYFLFLQGKVGVLRSSWCPEVEIRGIRMKVQEVGLGSGGEDVFDGFFF